MKPENSAAPVGRKLRRRRRRRWYVLLSVMLVACLGVMSVHIVGVIRLHQAIAEIERLDPSWRMVDLEAKRAVVPEEQNSALTVLAASQLLPTPWPTPVQPDETNADTCGLPLSSRTNTYPFQARLPEKWVLELRSEIKRADAALPQARLLAELPRGRLPFPADAPWKSLNRPSNGQILRVIDLLHMDALLLAEEEEADQALASCRGILNAGRAVGDEPLAISQMYRQAGQKRALDTLRRLLAQGQPAGGELTLTQKLLEDEAAYPLLLVAFRGERAWQDRIWTALAKGDPPIEVLSGRPTKRPTGLWDSIKQLFQPRPIDSLTNSGIGWFEEWFPQYAHSECLRAMTQWVELAKLPVEEQWARSNELKKGTVDGSALEQAISGSLGRLVQSSFLTQTVLRCAVAALAAEQFRQQKSRWPTSMEELTATNYLDSVPTDPFDGHALRIRRLADGLVIYSVGPDRSDDGGSLHVKYPPEPKSDVGFRLWDPEHRRQPPQPFKPPE